MTLRSAAAAVSEIPASEVDLSAEDRAQIATCGSRRRREILSSRALLRDIFSNVTGASAGGIAHDHAGRPYLVDAPRLAVSIAHSREWVAVALTDRGAVGVDLEHVGAVFDRPGLALRMCTRREFLHVGGLPMARRRIVLAQLWTAKEAILKAHGIGLRRDPRSVEVADFGVQRPAWTPAGYAAAVAVLPAGARTGGA